MSHSYTIFSIILALKYTKIQIPIIFTYQKLNISKIEYIFISFLIPHFNFLILYV